MSLFSAVSATIFSSAAAEISIDDNFNNVLLERSTVAIEDHSDKYPWTFQGSKRDIRCINGVLSFGAAPGTGEIRMISKKKFKSGTLKARIKFDKTGSDVHYYIGFFQLNPWHYRSAWVLFNGSTNGHLYMTNGPKKMPAKMVQKIRTGNMEVGKWYDLTIKLDNSGSELFINNVSQGKLALPEVAPNGGLNVIIFANPGSKGAALQIDNLSVKGVEDTSKTQKIVVKKVEIPVPPAVKTPAAKIDTNTPATIVVQKKLVQIENGFFRFTFDTANGLTLNEFFSKYLNRNVLLKPGRFFAIHHENKMLPNASFKVTSVKTSGNEQQKSVVFALNNPEEKISGTITLTVKADSPELNVKTEFVNNSSTKNVFGVSCPLLGNMQIGKDIAGDEFFFPMESGMAGKLDCTLRQVYGMTLFMQLLSVWNPQDDGGVYAYTKDKTGYPKIMELKHRSSANASMAAYPVVPWSSLNQTLFDNGIGSSMGWRHFDFDLAPGKKTNIPDAVIGVNKGAWQSGMKSYSDFVKTWFKKPYTTPKWYTETYALLSAHPHSGLWMFSSSPSRGYYNKKANEYSYGKSITHLEKNVLQEIAFWWDKPARLDVPTEEIGKFGLPFINVHMEGDYDYNVSRGGLKALKDEIALIHSKESRLILYTMVRGAAKGTKAFEIGKKWAHLNVYGRPRTDYTAEGIGWNFCDMEQDFAAHYSKLLAKRVAETNADGYRLDVLCRISPCYNPAHGHYDGTLRSTANAELLGETLKKFKGELTKVSPEKIVTVEHAGNDYISQFHDGYFAENICWISESPMWADFRKLNSYMTVFTRFYFPEVKTWIHGASRTDEAIRMSLFNACGFACTSHKGIRSFRTLEENSDVFDSNAEKIPHIPTLNNQVFANEFCGDDPHGKHIWTVFNRSGKEQRDLLKIDEVKGDFRYMEVYNDEKVSTFNRNGKTTLTIPLPHNEVAVIVRFVKQLKASVNGSDLTVNVDNASGKHCRIIYGKDDFMAPQKDIPFTNGCIKTKIPAGTSKVTVKLYSGKYLIDQIVIKR
ncbi:MAG: hypothetical protein E7058_09000 [Lentisphaerae bacterium]|nr:hypothetical protein [Lentisphaerota bacterium]